MRVKEIITCAVLLLAGCAPGLDAVALRERANGMREDLNALGDDVRDAHAGAVALCALELPATAEGCHLVADVGPRINDTWSGAALVIDGLELGLTSFDDAEQVLAKARDIADEMSELLQRVKRDATPGLD